jgi:hypothetical protein
MGFGEYLGNVSVHWVVGHEDLKGQAVPLAAKAGQPGHPKKGHDVHVDKAVHGKDPVALEDIGRRKGHTGRFRVRLRFERMQDAREAAAAAQSVMFEDGMYVLVLDVPVIKRNDAADPPPSEVRVDW